MRYARILAAVAGTPWAIREEKGRAMIDALLFSARGGKRSLAELDAILGLSPGTARRENREDAAPTQAAEGRGQQGAGAGIAVLSLSGILTPRLSSEMDCSSGGGTSAEGFTRRLRSAMTDARIGGVIIDVDSPGGNVLGISEAAAALYATRGADKPVVAVANHDCCSAAYHLASAAGELVASPSSEVGAIGVYTYHEDISKALEMEGVAITLVKSGPHKAETFPAFPLSEEARAHMQTRADDYYRMFLADVAKARGVTAAEVEKRFGGGRALGADAALRAGMIDRVATIDDEIARMAERLTKSRADAGRGQVAMAARRLARW